MGQALRTIIVNVGSDVAANASQQTEDADGVGITTGFASDGKGKYIVPAGTPVWLEFLDALTVEAAEVGRTLPMVLWSSLEVLPGENLANNDSPAPVEIARVVRDGPGGEIGALALRLEYVQVGPNRIKLRATPNSEPGDSEVLIPVHDYLVDELTSKQQILVPKFTRFRVFVAVTIALPVAADTYATPDVPTDLYP